VAGIRHRPVPAMRLPIATDATLASTAAARSSRGFVGWRALPGSMAAIATRAPALEIPPPAPPRAGQRRRGAAALVKTFRGVMIPMIGPGCDRRILQGRVRHLSRVAPGRLDRPAGQLDGGLARLVSRMLVFGVGRPVEGEPAPAGVRAHAAQEPGGYRPAGSG